MGVLTKAYGGRAIITFNEAKHYYTVTCPRIFDGKLYQPSVTSAIGKLDKSGGLVPWAVGEMAARLKQLAMTSETWDTDALLAIIDVAQDTWRKSKQEAADIGTVAHRFLEKVLLGETPKLPLKYDDLVNPDFTQDMIDQANNAIEAGMEFIRKHRIKVVQAEAPRWSPTHGYIGTGDLIAYIDDKLSVLDWKTSRRLYPTVKMQLSAYMNAYQEEFPDQFIEQGVAVNIGKDGKLDDKTYDHAQLQEDFKAFLALLDAWRWDRQNQSDPRWNQDVPRRLEQHELALILAA